MTIARQRLIFRHNLRKELIIKTLKEFEILTPEVLSRPGPGGGWSVLQTLYHLYLSERGSFQYLEKKLLSQAEDLYRPTLTQKRNGILLLLSLWSPFKFKAPAVIDLDKQPAPPDLETLRKEWLALLDAWEKLLENLPESYLDKAVYRHPKAGRISWAHTLGFMHAHLLRHRKQAQRAARG